MTTKEQWAAYRKAHYERRKAQGRCIVCGEKTKPRQTRCERCRIDARNRARKRNGWSTRRINANPRDIPATAPKRKQK